MRYIFINSLSSLRDSLLRVFFYSYVYHYYYIDYVSVRFLVKIQSISSRVSPNLKNKTKHENKKVRPPPWLLILLLSEYQGNLLEKHLILTGWLILVISGLGACCLSSKRPNYSGVLYDSSLSMLRPSLSCLGVTLRGNSFYLNGCPEWNESRNPLRNVNTLSLNLEKYEIKY